MAGLGLGLQSCMVGRRRAEEGVRQIQWVGCAGWFGMFGNILRILPKRCTGWQPCGKGQLVWSRRGLGPRCGAVGPLLSVGCPPQWGGGVCVCSPPVWGSGSPSAGHIPLSAGQASSGLFTRGFCPAQGWGGEYERDVAGAPWSCGERLREAGTRRKRPRLGAHEVMAKCWWVEERKQEARAV